MIRIKFFCALDPSDILEVDGLQDSWSVRLEILRSAGPRLPAVVRLDREQARKLGQELIAFAERGGPPPRAKWEVE